MPRQFNRLMESGVDALTMGDHLYKRREIIAVLRKQRSNRQARELSRPVPLVAPGPSFRPSVANRWQSSH